MAQSIIAKRYKGIDIFKLICVFFVIMIHVSPCGGDCPKTKMSFYQN